MKKITNKSAQEMIDLLLSTRYSEALCSPIFGEVIAEMVFVDNIIFVKWNLEGCSSNNEYNIYSRNEMVDIEIKFAQEIFDSRTKILEDFNLENLIDD